MPNLRSAIFPFPSFTNKLGGEFLLCCLFPAPFNNGILPSENEIFTPSDSTLVKEQTVEKKLKNISRNNTTVVHVTLPSDFIENVKVTFDRFGTRRKSHLERYPKQFPYQRSVSRRVSNLKSPC